MNKIKTMDTVIKLIAFDLDGTIADTIPMCIKAFREAVEPYTGHELSEEEIVQTFGLNEEGMIKQVIADKGDLSKALEDFYEIYSKMHLFCPDPFDGVKELIAELKNSSTTIALITGKGKRSCEITLQQFSMENYFDRIETGSAEKNRKSEVIQDLLNSYQLHSNEMVYIGDAVSDITESRKAGVRCLSAAWAKSTDAKKLLKHNEGFFFLTIESLKEYLFQRLNK